MGAVAKALHRGADGSVHYLSSTVDGSLLIIADPAYGVVKIPLEGPCRQVPRGPNLPAGYVAVVYESISATGSTLLTVSPGRPPFEHTIGGVCSSCMQGEHDFESWPVCPRPLAQPVKKPSSASSPGMSATPNTPPEAPAKGKARERWLDAKKPAPEPEPEPVPVRGMEPVPVANGSGWTNLADIDGPSWGPS